MTPTREQLIEEIAGKLWLDLCEGDGQHSESLDKALIRKHLDRLAACLAAPPQAQPEPQAMPPIEIGDVARLDGFGLVTVNRSEEAAVLSLGSDGLAAIYKPVWTRQPRP